MISISTNIPGSKVAQFHEIVCATNGRYARGGSPARYGNYFNGEYRVTVEFESDGYVEFSKRWAQCITPITEVKSPWYIRLLRKIKGRL
jgi:hypothetical protein